MIAFYDILDYFSVKSPKILKLTTVNDEQSSKTQQKGSNKQLIEKFASFQQENEKLNVFLTWAFLMKSS